MIRKISIVIFTLVLGVTLNAQIFKVDKSESELAWKGKKIGGQHWGNIDIKEGSFTLKNDKIISGEFIIDMSTITCIDLENEGMNQKLVGHLKSDDFFGVEMYPEASLTLKSSTPLENGNTTIEAELTIKGKTHPITFDAKKNGNSFTAFIKVDRTLYDVRYGSKKFFASIGDRAINDIFTMDVKLVAYER